MGLFSALSGSAPEDKRAEEVRTGAVAPLRTERAKCYAARDAYFACLDKNNIIDALKDEKAAARACGEQSKEFEKDCATAWVGLPFPG
jgi:cytochrome c oxidase assembly factor 6